jgi:hypothetical protein
MSLLLQQMREIKLNIYHVFNASFAWKSQWSSSQIQLVIRSAIFKYMYEFTNQNQTNFWLQMHASIWFQNNLRGGGEEGQF